MCKEKQNKSHSELSEEAFNKAFIYHNNMEKIIQKIKKRAHLSGYHFRKITKDFDPVYYVVHILEDFKGEVLKTWECYLSYECCESCSRISGGSDCSYYHATLRAHNYHYSEKTLLEILEYVKKLYLLPLEIQ